MMSVKEGVYGNMIDSMVGSFVGYAQVHTSGYWNERTIDNSFEPTPELLEKVASTKGVVGNLQRIESFALTASDSMTKVAMVVGVDIEQESKFNQLNERVAEGKYISSDDKSVLVGDGLAEYLKVGVGDTLILMGQGYHGISAEGKYPIKGIVKFGNPELSKQMVFMPLKEAQWFYSLDGMINNMILELEDPSMAVQTANHLRTELDTTYEVMDWYQLMPEIQKMIDTDRVEGYVFMFILYMVISFGIFGTSLMMLAERKRELGVLVAVGMRRRKLAVMVWLEVLMMSVAGAFLGMLGAYPVSYYFNVNPIRFGEDMGDIYEEYGMEAVMQFSTDPAIFLQQAVIIAIIASVIAIYPVVKILRINAIEYMRN